jgi:hypothetical protein
MRVPTFGAAVLLTVVTAIPVRAQEPTPGADSAGERISSRSAVVEVRLTDGSALFGRIVEGRETGGDVVRLELLSGDVILLRRDRIRDVRPLRGRLVDGEVWRRDPNATRLFFGPTGRSLEAGKAYFGVYELVVPFLAVGVTDGFTLSGGTPLTLGDGDRIFWVAPKLRIVGTEGVSAAVGVLHLIDPGSSDPYDDTEGFGVAYGVATIGSRDRATTFGLGYGYSGDDLADHPVVMVGGELRTSRMVKLMTENYLFPGEGALLSAGLRFMGERLSADLGLVTPRFGSDDLILFPLVNFVYNW